MMLINPVRDFYLKAAMHAKQIRLSEFNQLEAELMILEELLLKITGQITVETANDYHSKISAIKKTIKEKKREFL